MAGRPPLPVGAHGAISTRVMASGRHQARCYFRDPDGVSRLVSATGRSAPAAVRELRTRLAARTAGAGGEIGPDTRVRVVAEEWMRAVEDRAAAGELSPGTEHVYRSALDRHVLPAVGDLRLRELTPGRVNRALVAIGQRAGRSAAKSCRTVISRIATLARQHDAITSNPASRVTTISTKPRREPRALSPAECARWLALLAADEHAVRHDLVDLVTFLLATGCRIGEALAVAWEDVDLTAGTVAIDHTLIRVKGRGLLRKATKTKAGMRTLPLPGFAGALLARRAVELRVLATSIIPARPDVAGSVAALGSSPVFPSPAGTWRDLSSTQRALRAARGGEFGWVTSHVFRKTAATMMDRAGLTAREIAAALGHTRPSLTQDVYMERRVTDRRAAAALEGALQTAFPMNNPCIDLGGGSGDAL